MNAFAYRAPLALGLVSLARRRSSPFNTLTPCVEGCDPHGFGFNSTDTQIVVGDGTSGGHLDIGQVSENQWKKVTKPRFTVPFSSAVYVPGD